MITRQLNPQAKAITDASSEIKIIVNKMYFEGRSKAEIERKVREIIKKYKLQLTSEQLRKMMPPSMTLLYQTTLLTLIVAFGASGRKAQQRMKDVVSVLERKATANTLNQGVGSLVYDAQRAGQPLKEYCKTYMQKVKDVYRRLAKEEAQDLDGINATAKRNTLRNRAEMQVCYEYHQEQVQTFKDKGVRLVVCSSHQDCSLRCFPWQGRVYSLDGSAGTTEDGRKYVPLEMATNQNNVYYVNPNTGTQYKGGLFGYNCRHRLIEYKVGMGIPTVTKAQQQREDALNQRQRQYEKTVRNYRTEADLAKGAGLTKQANLLHKRAAAVYEEYKEFSINNERAYYPDRCSIL